MVRVVEPTLSKERLLSGRPYVAMWRFHKTSSKTIARVFIDPFALLLFRSGTRIQIQFLKIHGLMGGGGRDGPLIALRRLSLKPPLYSSRISSRLGYFF